MSQSFLKIAGFTVALFAAHPALAATVAHFAPHEAVYQLNLAQNRQASQVISAHGSLRFALTDTCDGWTTDQKLEINFLYAQGQESRIIVNSSSWESKDGDRYTFSSRTLNNGQETESFRGHAAQSAQGGEAIYTLPKGRKIALKPGTIFPSQHSMLILQRAQAGERVPNYVVFDGTDEKPQNDVSVFLGKPVTLENDPSVETALRGDKLLQGVAWPTQLAFFAQPEADLPPQKDDDDNAETGVPDYELKLDLLANGVARKLLIDYGNFAVGGTLATLKALPDAGCP